MNKNLFNIKLVILPCFEKKITEFGLIFDILHVVRRPTNWHIYLSSPHDKKNFFDKLLNFESGFFNSLEFENKSYFGVSLFKIIDASIFHSVPTEQTDLKFKVNLLDAPFSKEINWLTQNNNKRFLLKSLIPESYSIDENLYFFHWGEIFNIKFF